jgi:hypothetical protein
MGRNRNGSNELLESLIGMNKESGTELCKENDYKVRITREDSNNYAITMDLRFDRINLEIDKGLITKCDIG